MIIGIIRYGKTIIIHPLAQPKPVPCSCWSMFFWKTQQKCHVIVNKLHDIDIEIYRGIEQTYFCRFLFGKSRAITFLCNNSTMYVHLEWLINCFSHFFMELMIKLVILMKTSEFIMIWFEMIWKISSESQKFWHAIIRIIHFLMIS